jgi:hypothetical protein
MMVRMPKMKLLVLTLPYTQNGYTFASIILLQDPPKMSKMTEEQVLLNSRSVRRFDWDDLLSVPPSRFKIDLHSKTSEAGVYHKHLPEDCAKIDNLGYITK